MIDENSRFIIANITWNDSGWRNIYVNPKAGHRYARKFPGHESLNFDFNKKGLDTVENVFGYVQWIGSPKKFSKNGVIFFYSKNLKNKQNEIVGVFGNTEIIYPLKITKWLGFENDELISNIKANKELSILFSIPLNAKKFSTKRLVPQAGFKYIDLKLASQIIFDEIEELKKAGITRDELTKLTKIFEFVTGMKYDISTINTEYQNDEKEQEELEQLVDLPSVNKTKLVQELKQLNPKLPETIEFKGKSYKRDNKTIIQLKILRNFKCQICEKTIHKKNGGLYIEAAHIKSKSSKGPESPDNILILCPNHHKEFDFGNRKILEHTTKQIVFELNGQRHEVNLSLE